jgi:uroporphyrinogen decarboxylase
MSGHRIPLDHPRPDIRRFIDTVMGTARGGRTPLVEYLIDPAVMRPILTGLLGRAWVDYGPTRESQKAYLDNAIVFWERMGYDFVRFEQGLPFPEGHLEGRDDSARTGRRSWADEHRGAIATWDDFERYPWPRVEEFDFFPFEYLAEHLPEGMGLITCHAGGIFEHLSWILSLEGMSYALADDPALVQAVADRIGRLLLDFYAHLLDLPNLAALFPGDDMGFKTGPLIAPLHLRRLVLPWHEKFAALAHGRGLPYFLHSCGNLAAIMDELIEGIGIDGKHSFEDAIMPAEDFQARWGSRLAVLGGIDLNILSKGAPDDVRSRTRRLIEVCGAKGRFAVGSGNSIPSYVPVENYLAMVDEALDVSTYAGFRADPPATG